MDKSTKSRGGCGRRRARRDLAPVPEPRDGRHAVHGSPARARRPSYCPDARVPRRRTEKVSNLRRVFFELRTRGNNITRFRSLTVNNRVCECDSSWMLFQPAGTSTSVGVRDRQSVVFEIQPTTAGVSNGDIARVPERHLLLPPEWPRGTVCHFPVRASLGDELFRHGCLLRVLLGSLRW